MNKSAQIVEGAVGGAFLFEDVYPSIDGSRFPVKRVVGERVEVWADIIHHGRDVTAASLIWRREGERDSRRAPMTHHSNDRWFGAFIPEEPGRYSYAIEAWTDQFATWRQAFMRKRHAGIDVDNDAIEGAGMLTKAQAGGTDATSIILRQCETFLQTGDAGALLTDELKEAMAESQFRLDLTRSQLFPLIVDRERARFAAWCDMAPRSQGTAPGPHETFKDCIARLADVEAMGFDVICLPPVHPGSTSAGPVAEGGRGAGYPELGTIEDFRDFVAACRPRGLELALTFAAQCSLDHPWLTEHPQWFRRRPDGSPRAAEMDGETCEDIVLPDFDCADAGALWDALRDVVLFWIEQGVKIFRVDNPERTPLPFWEWLIQEIQHRHADVIFVAGAVARPKLMTVLAKLGFTQCCAFLASRTQKWELEQYVAELTAYPAREFLRPNFFVNTADMLSRHPDSGESWMFRSRVALAGTLSSSYAIFNGFELAEHEAMLDHEDYLNSDKFQIKVRDWNTHHNIKSYISALNRIRRDNAALQQNSNLHFVTTDDSNVIAFVKQSADQTNSVGVAIALSPDVHEFWLPLGDTLITVDGERRHVAAVENLVTGEQSALDWGGIKLRIEPDRDPALFFRCLA